MEVMTGNKNEDVDDDDIDVMLAADFQSNTSRRSSLDRSSSFPPQRMPSRGSIGNYSDDVGFGIVAHAKHLRYKDRSNRRLMSHLTLSERDITTTRSIALGEKASLISHGTADSFPEKDMTGETVFEALRDLIFGSYVSILLIFAPFAIASHYLGWSPTAIFWLNFLTMIPLASILGDFTEEVAAHTNEVIGGLVNATFGNAVEVVVAIQALLANEIRVVQASMIGSMFSNLLLVLGTCFFCGGLIYKEQSFNTTAATANMSLLGLSGIALTLPTPFAQYYGIYDESVLIVSRFAAMFLMAMYLQLLFFQLRTHAHLFRDQGEPEVARISFTVSIVGLFLVTLLVAFFSNFLVASIDGFVEGTRVSRTFVGLIIIPIVGNAVEHITAVSVAMKDKMDLAMGVAVGSCVQIALFVVPLTVLVGWGTGKPMSLNFGHFEVTLLILSILVVHIILSNSKANWLVGSLLMTTYVMIAVGFWYEQDEENTEGSSVSDGEL